MFSQVSTSMQLQITKTGYILGPQTLRFEPFRPIPFNATRFRLMLFNSVSFRSIPCTDIRGGTFTEGYLMSACEIGLSHARALCSGVLWLIAQTSKHLSWRQDQNSKAPNKTKGCRHNPQLLGFQTPLLGVVKLWGAPPKLKQKWNWSVGTAQPNSAQFRRSPAPLAIQHASIVICGL